MEVAIVVVSVMLSGTEPLHDGAIKIGEHCHDPLRSTRQITDYTDPIVADHPGSERDFYENFCHDPRLANKDACESDLGRFPAVTGTTAATGRCQWGARAVTTMEVRLAVLVLGHALMALYFMNPLSLMSGELWCTPYRDKGPFWHGSAHRGCRGCQINDNILLVTCPDLSSPTTPAGAGGGADIGCPQQIEEELLLEILEPVTADKYRRFQAKATNRCIDNTIVCALCAAAFDHA
jgi:hypothetical protein